MVKGRRTCCRGRGVDQQSNSMKGERELTNLSLGIQQRPIPILQLLHPPTALIFLLPILLPPPLIPPTRQLTHLHPMHQQLQLLLHATQLGVRAKVVQLQESDEERARDVRIVRV